MPDSSSSPSEFDFIPKATTLSKSVDYKDIMWDGRKRRPRKPLEAECPSSGAKRKYRRRTRVAKRVADDPVPSDPDSDSSVGNPFIFMDPPYDVLVADPGRIPDAMLKRFSPITPDNEPHVLSGKEISEQWEFVGKQHGGACYYREAVVNSIKVGVVLRLLGAAPRFVSSLFLTPEMVEHVSGNPVNEETGSPNAKTPCDRPATVAFSCPGQRVVSCVPLDAVPRPALTPAWEALGLTARQFDGGISVSVIELPQHLSPMVDEAFTYITRRIDQPPYTKKGWGEVPSWFSTFLYVPPTNIDTVQAVLQRLADVWLAKIHNRRRMTAIQHLERWLCLTMFCTRHGLPQETLDALNAGCEAVSGDIEDIVTFDIADEVPNDDCQPQVLAEELIMLFNTACFAEMLGMPQLIPSLVGPLRASRLIPWLAEARLDYTVPEHDEPAPRELARLTSTFYMCTHVIFAYSFWGAYSIPDDLFIPERDFMRRLIAMLEASDKLHTDYVAEYALAMSVFVPHSPTETPAETDALQSALTGDTDWRWAVGRIQQESNSAAEESVTNVRYMSGTLIRPMGLTWDTMYHATMLSAAALHYRPVHCVALPWADEVRQAFAKEEERRASLPPPPPRPTTPEPADEESEEESVKEEPVPEEHVPEEPTGPAPKPSSVAVSSDEFARLAEEQARNQDKILPKRVRKTVNYNEE